MSSKIPIVAIVGRPNVGKSTLFNRLVGRKQAIIAKEAGTTRDTISSEIIWNNKKFILLDTAGLINDFFGYKEAQIEKLAQDKVDDALLDCDLILFVVDAKTGILPEDKLIARNLRKLNKEIIVIWNKADNSVLESKIDEVNEFGFSRKVAVSSISGKRSGLLLDEVTSRIPKTDTEVSDLKKLTIVGRPNAGKSTIFNLLSDSNLAIVSDIPGTTRDAINLKINLPGTQKELEIIDTAGFRKRGKIQVGIEKFSILRAIESIYKANIIVLVVDASEGLTRTDAHLAQMALDKKKTLIVLINKIDLLKSRSSEEVKNFSRFKFILKNKIIAISSKTKENFDLFVSELAKEV
jgi:GTP-binding protein